MKKIKGFVALSMVLLGTLLFLMSNCNDDENEEEPAIPSLSTVSASRITDNSANTGGCITLDNSATVTACGVCWGTAPLPTVAGGKTNDGASTGSFTSSLDNLTPDTKYYIRAYATCSGVTYYGNELNFSTPPLLTDIDGNTYHTVQIGTQVWMSENLKVTHYRDGQAIPLVTGHNEWVGLTSGAYCEYNNSAAFADIYGKLYNFYALLDPRNLAPPGWHVPTDADWKILEGNVDSRYSVGNVAWEGAGERGYDAGGKLKSKSNHWSSPNIGANDTSGFSALPAGVRDPVDGSYKSVNLGAFFGTASAAAGENQMWYRDLWYENSFVERLTTVKSAGGSVRLVKD